MKHITLPNNGFGVFLMLCAVLMIITLPFVITVWLVSLIAPWWVALPCGFSASLITFLLTVKINKPLA